MSDRLWSLTYMIVDMILSGRYGDMKADHITAVSYDPEGDQIWYRGDLEVAIHRVLSRWDKEGA